MGSKKPSYYDVNLPKLYALCADAGYEIEEKSIDQFRVYGATHIIDIWPARMVYHRIGGEVVTTNEPYVRDMDWEFNDEQVRRLLATGDHHDHTEPEKPTGPTIEVVLVVNSSELQRITIESNKPGKIDSQMMKLGNVVKGVMK